MSLRDTLETLCQQHGLACILAINDEGLVMAEAGTAPAEEFAPYLPMAVETSNRMAENGGFGEPLCNALVLSGGSMLIMYRTLVAGRAVYLSLLCSRVPAGLKTLLERITNEVAGAIGA